MAAKIATKVVKPIAVNTKRKLRITVRARDLVPAGTVKIRVKGAGEKKSHTRTLNLRGRTKVWLPKFRRTGKVTIRIRYLGDQAVAASNKKISLKVVNRRAVP